MKKRVLAWLLALTMTTSLFAVPVVAEPVDEAPVAEAAFENADEPAVTETVEAVENEEPAAEEQVIAGEPAAEEQIIESEPAAEEQITETEPVEGEKETEVEAEQDAVEEEACEAPVAGVVIMGQPSYIQAGVGQTVIFDVRAENVASYQWQYSKDGGTWYKSGATGNTTKALSIKVSTSNAANIYRCKLTGFDGEVLYTEFAGVDLIPGAKIIKQPTNQVAVVGKQASFTIEADNVPMARSPYQWFYSKDGTNWYKTSATGATSSTLTVNVSNNNKGYKYRCQVLGLDGNKIWSKTVGFIVITKQPVASNAKVGETATFRVEATGIDAYQWYYSKDDGVTWYKSNATGATTDTLTIKVSNTNKTNKYRCKLTRDGGDGYTDPCGFGEHPVITQQPEDVRSVQGYKVSIPVVAENVEEYLWQYSVNGTSWNTSSLSTAKTDTLELTLSEKNKVNQYRCKITGTDGCVIYTRPVSIHAHVLYYGYDPTRYGEYGVTTTSEHYVYCKDCYLKREYTEHIWNEPAEGAECTVCGAYLYPDMYDGNNEKIFAVPLDAPIVSTIANEHCTHENASVHFGPLGWSRTCFLCGVNETGGAS